MGVPRPGAGAGAVRRARSAHRAACASRHKGATPPNADAGVECVVWGVGCGIIPLGGKGTKTQLECIIIWGTKNGISNI